MRWMGMVMGGHVNRAYYELPKTVSLELSSVSRSLNEGKS